MKLVSYGHVFKELLKTDMLIIKPQLKNKLIDLFIWIGCVVLVNAYIMPYFGLSVSYGAFMLASVCASAGIFDVYGGIVQFVSDLEGERVLDYYFTLPIPSWLVCIRSMVYYALNTVLMGLFVLPVGKLMLWDRFDLSSISLFKFTIIFCVSNALCGVLVLWTASYVKSMFSIGSVWMRFIYPLWFLGCFQFSWLSLYAVAPWLAYANLLNPMTYITEGYRVAILGQEGSLNFWLCSGMLILFAMLFAIQAIKRLQRRLDFL